MGGHYGVPLERSDYLELAPHRNSCTPDGFPQWLEKHGPGRRLALDLFSGAGGLSLGLERAGWTVAAAVDFDKRALETHAHNFPGLSLHMDLGDPAERDRLVEMLEPATIDLVAGGPPCQPFSRAGRSKIRSLVRDHGRDPQDRRKELWGAYLDIAIRLKPRVILMENVPDMGLGDDFFVVRTIEEKLERAGYATQVRLVNAWAYGVPQHRKRLILLARNDVDQFTWPAVVPRTTLRDAISDLPPICEGKIGGRSTPYEAPADLSPFAKEMRKGVSRSKVWDHMTRHVRDDDREIFAGMDAKSLYRDIPEHLRRYDAVHFKDKYKKLDWNDLSRTITAHIAKDGYWYIHPEQLRTLTVREAARVQTFPDRFRFAGTRSDAFRQIGNAVPPMLGQAAALALVPDPAVIAPADGLKAYWLDVRNDLTQWAKGKRSTDLWHQFPGPALGPVQAAVAAALSASRTHTPAASRVMDLVADAKRLERRVFGDLLALAPTARARTSLERLGPLVGGGKAWKKPLEIPVAVGFKPGESALYQLLLGEDLLLVSQGPFRVAARVNGSTADRENRLTDGRVELARLVGSGEEAPLRMAALRHIGMTVCRERQPLCTDCPLKSYCISRADTLEEVVEPPAS